MALVKVLQIFIYYQCFKKKLLMVLVVFLGHLICRRKINYKKGICPVAEELHGKTFINFEICLFEMNSRK